MLSRRLVLALSLLAVYALGVIAQQPPPKRPPEELLRLSLAAEKPGLAEPLTGVTTNGRIESGLFSVRSSGVSTAALATAAEHFWPARHRNNARRRPTRSTIPESREWMDQSFHVRQGVSFLEMTAPQRELALGLLRAALSARG